MRAHCDVAGGRFVQITREVNDGADTSSHESGRSPLPDSQRKSQAEQDLPGPQRHQSWRLPETRHNLTWSRWIIFGALKIQQSKRQNRI
ncbi:hypothetical protein HYDPIDRAFT_108411 [Hydnomerulius pinastri MD-312]|nr:hypothetical protein HYDPIDRAFT_108411 [Hydnomerulius pinastri MD-312]